MPVDENAKAIIENAIEAMGGAKHLKNVKDITIIHRHASFEDTIRYRAPDRITRESNFPWASLCIGFDGTFSWVKATDNTVSFEEGKSAVVQWLFHRIDTLLITKVIDSDASVEYIGGKSLRYFEAEEMVQKPVSLIKATFPDGWIFRLYFCRDRGLLVKEEYRHTEHQTRYVERFFDAHKKVKHILLPSRIYELNPHSKAIKRIRVKYEINKGLHRRSFKVPEQCAELQKENTGR